jgi:probable F420-dependent oxidoreductase
MKFLYAFPYATCPVPEEMTSGDTVSALAQAAESAGFDAIGFYEHPAPSEKWRQSGGHDALDPYVALAFASVATSDIGLATFLSPLPYRNPFLAAKAVATLDCLSGGRVILGVGVGYLRSEFAALGADFETRNESFDEAVDVLRLAWTGQSMDYEGGWFQAHSVTCLPRPLQRPHPPIWIGGNSRRSRRRAAAFGAAWAPTPTTPQSHQSVRTAAIGGMAELSRLIDDLQDLADSEGRRGQVEVVFSVVPPNTDVPLSEHVEIVRALADVGVDWAVVHGLGSTSDAATEWIGSYGRDVIGETAGVEESVGGGHR